MNVYFEGMKIIMRSGAENFGIGTWIFLGVAVILMFSSLAFWKERIARWVFYSFNLAAVVMTNMAFAIVGPGEPIIFEKMRILGMAHLICWTPITVLLIINLSKYGYKTNFGKWAHATAFISMIVLIIDVADVSRYFLTH